MNKVAAVLFDLDGVLVEACELHRRALNDALSEFGYTITEEEHYDRYNGRPTRVKLQMLTSEKGLSVALHDEISRKKQLYTGSLTNQLIQPCVAIQELLLHLRYVREVDIACCSNSVRGSVEHLLSAARLRDLIDICVGNDEGVNPKPAPDLFLEGARRLGVPIDKCVIVEDSPIGLQAARAACPLRVVDVKNSSEVNLSLLPRLSGE